MNRLNNDQKITCMDLAVRAVKNQDPIKTVKNVEDAIEKVYTKIVSLIEGDEKSVDEGEYQGRQNI